MTGSFLERAWEFTLSDDNVLIDLFPGFINKKAIVNRFFNFLPNFACFPFSANSLFDRALKKTARFVHIPNFFQ